MQAYRAAATVSEDQELLISGVPFPPGVVLEVILLDNEARRASTDDVTSSVTSASSLQEQSESSADGKAEKDVRDARDMAQEQYRLARQHPDEYVVMIGRRIVDHTPDRQLMFRAYRKALADFPSENPVVVDPGRGQKKALVVRGRSSRKVEAK